MLKQHPENRRLRNKVSIESLSVGVFVFCALMLSSPLVLAATDAAIYFIHSDQLGTPQQLTNETAAVVWEVDYEPFGNASLATNVVTNNLRFPGQYFDSGTPLSYNYFRDYHPATGRFLQSDPIGLRGGVNTYSYVDANPIRYHDRFGLESFDGKDLGALVSTGKVSFGVTGTIGFVTLGFTLYGDNLAAINVLPEASLYFLVCEEPANKCIREKRSFAPVDIALIPGRLLLVDSIFFGLILRANGAQCFVIGPSAGFPINASLNSERPLFPNRTGLQ